MWNNTVICRYKEIFFRSKVFLDAAKAKIIHLIESEVDKDKIPLDNVCGPSKEEPIPTVDPSLLNQPTSSSISQQIMKRIRLEKMQEVGNIDYSKLEIL